MKIEAKKIAFAYQKKSNNILTDASINLESGNIYFLCGKNGSGKTTFVNILLGLLKEQSGQIFINGRNVKKIRAGKRADKIGYIFQNPDLQLFAPTVLDEIYFPYKFAKIKNENIDIKIQNLLKEFNLINLENRFPQTLSGGEKQRLALATILSREIEFLILDEPTASIDENGKIYLSNFINKFKENGGGILIISHDEEFLDYIKVDKKMSIKNGGIYET